MPNKMRMAFGLSLLGIALPLLRAEVPEENGPKQSFEVTSTERVHFAPGGIIRVNDSYGYLAVEGWDEPEVEITVIKSTDSFYEPSQKEQEEQRFAQFRVVTERRSDTELAILTLPSGRKSALGRMIGTWPPLPNARRGVTVECRVHVPRDSRLVVHHDHGYVWVSDVTGDLEVRSHTGDMIVLLPDPGPYAIDARAGIGNVSADFVGKAKNRYVVGTRFAYAGSAPSRRIFLRMGRGCITIKEGPPSGPVGKD